MPQTYTFASWNVNGLRAVLKKDPSFIQIAQELDVDILALQETKLQEGQVDIDLPGYHQTWSYAERKGYSGTAVFSRQEPLRVLHADALLPYAGEGEAAELVAQAATEGRVCALEFDKFWFVDVYTPNAQNELARIDVRKAWDDAYRGFLSALERETGKPVVTCGDFNVAHEEIDLKNPKSNRGNAGFSDEERGKFTELLNSGFTDTWRAANPDVEGVYTADPRKIPKATKLKEITFDEMLELASLGAQVLNNRSVELAKKYNVELEVISSINPVPGTVVKEETIVEGMLIKGVAKDTDVAVLTVKDVPDVPGMSFKIFSLLAQKNINVDIILQTTGRDGKKDMSFTVPLGDAENAVAALKNATNRIGGGDITVDKTCAKVSIVGAGMQSHSGVASTMFEALFNQNINIKMISTSEIKISVIIDEADADKAVAAIHDAFIN